MVRLRIPPSAPKKTVLAALPLLLAGQAFAQLTPPAAPLPAEPPSLFTLRTYAPLLALLIPLAAYLTAQYKDWRSAQGILNKAFQGNNDAVAYMTHKVQHNEWKRRMKGAPGFRREVITALCLAWSEQPADYVKALLFDALLCVGQQGYGAETEHVLDVMLRRYEQYQERFGAAEFPRVIESLLRLRAELAAGELR